MEIHQVTNGKQVIGEYSDIQHAKRHALDMNIFWHQIGQPKYFVVTLLPTA